MHSTAKKTLAVIEDSKCDYIVGLKGNQPRLHRQAKALLAQWQQIDSSAQKVELNRGRIECRGIRVCDDVSKLDDHWRKAGVKQLICVERLTIRRSGRVSHQVSSETHYYVSSLKAPAWQYLSMIRSHWGIENSLHYVKDVVMNEDNNGIVKGQAPQNLSILKNIVINVLRTTKGRSIKTATRQLCNNIPEMLKLLT